MGLLSAERGAVALLSVEHGGTIVGEGLQGCCLQSAAGLLLAERGWTINGGGIVGRAESSEAGLSSVERGRAFVVGARRGYRLRNATSRGGHWQSLMRRIYCRRSAILSAECGESGLLLAERGAGAGLSLAERGGERISSADAVSRGYWIAIYRSSVLPITNNNIVCIFKLTNE